MEGNQTNSPDKSSNIVPEVFSSEITQDKMSTPSHDQIDNLLDTQQEVTEQPVESEDSDPDQANYTCTCDVDESSTVPDQIRKKKPKKNFILSTNEKKPKLRTSKDVYNRLKWDAASISIKGCHTVQGKDTEEDSLNLQDIYIGYKDRFLGICEIPYEDFEPGGGDIPYHRVYYFRTGGPPVSPFVGTNGEVKVRDDNIPEGAVFIWDRDSRTDLVFNSGTSSYLKDF